MAGNAPSAPLASVAEPDPRADGTSGRSPWVTVRQWLTAMRYEPLTAQTSDAARGEDPLHFVPHYDADRYLLVSSIPPTADAGIRE